MDDVPQAKPRTVALEPPESVEMVAFSTAPVLVTDDAEDVVTVVYGEAREVSIGNLPVTVDHIVEKFQEAMGSLVELLRKYVGLFSMAVQLTGSGSTDDIQRSWPELVLS